MSNTVHTKLSKTGFQGQSQPENGQQPRSGVGQDNPAPPRARIASPQPASLKKVMRAQRMSTTNSRSQNRPIPKRKTVKLTLWVKPVLKTELERLAKQQGDRSSS